MSQPYTTVEAIRARLGEERALVLLDHDEDGDEDSGTSGTDNVSTADDAIQEADDAIDGALGVRWTVPFASLPDTPAQVQQLSKDGAIALLYEWLQPDSEDAKTWRKRFDDKLKLYSSGTWTVVGGTPISSDAAGAARAVIVESAGTTFAGRVDDDYTETGADKFKF